MIKYKHINTQYSINKYIKYFVWLNINFWSNIKAIHENVRINIYSKYRQTTRSDRQCEEWNYLNQSKLISLYNMYVKMTMRLHNVIVKPNETSKHTIIQNHNTSISFLFISFSFLQNNIPIAHIPFFFLI